MRLQISWQIFQSIFLLLFLSFIAAVIGFLFFSSCFSSLVCFCRLSMSHKVVYHEINENENWTWNKSTKMVGHSNTTSLCVNGNKYGKEKNSEEFFMILSAFLDLRPRVLLRDMNLCYAFLFPFWNFFIFHIFCCPIFHGAFTKLVTYFFLVFGKYVIVILRIFWGGCTSGILKNTKRLWNCKVRYYL